MTRIRELVNILTGPHLHAGSSPEGPIFGVEDGLLLQLEQAIASSGSGTGGGNSTRAGLPVDLGAVDLYTSISRTVNSFLPPLGRLMSMSSRIQFWEGQSSGEDEKDVLERYLEQWVDQIREHLNPVPRRPLSGVSCPDCLTAVLPRILDGETVLVPVITIWPKQLYAECQKCEAVWQGTSQLMHLGLQQKGESV